MFQYSYYSLLLVTAAALDKRRGEVERYAQTAIEGYQVGGNDLVDAAVPPPDASTVMHTLLRQLNESQAQRSLLLLDAPQDSAKWSELESLLGRPLDALGVQFDQRGNLRLIDGGALGLPLQLEGTTPAEMAVSFLTNWAGLVQCPGIELSLTSVSSISGATVEFQQTHHGLPVFGSKILVRLDPVGARVQSLLGHVIPGHLLPADGLGPPPLWSTQQASASGLSVIDGTAELGVYDPVLFAGQNAKPAIAWRVLVVNEEGLPYRAFFDPYGGSLLHVHPEYFALELKNVYHVNTQLCGPSDCVCLQLLPGTTSEVCDLAGQIWNYYSLTYGRDGWDDQHNSTNHAVDFYSDYYANERAYWFSDGSMLVGSQAVCSDVIGHEFAHGVILDEAQLPGNALGEGLADVLGEFFSQSAGVSDWLITTGSPSCDVPIRDMMDPGALDDPNNNTGYPDHYSNYWADAVFPEHFNATIIGKLGYLLGRPTAHGAAEHWGRIVTGIGRVAAEGVFYHAIADALIPIADYSGLRFALVTAAEATGSSTIVEATRAATEAVGLWSIDYSLGIESSSAARSVPFTVNAALRRYLLWKSDSGPLLLKWKACELNAACRWSTELSLGWTSHSPGQAVVGTAMHFAWKDAYSNSIQWRYMDSSGVLSTTTSLSYLTDSDVDAAAAAGRFYVFWKGVGAGEQPLAGAFIGGGNWTALPPLPIDAVSATGPAVAGDSAGNVWIAYIRTIGVMKRVVVRKYSGGIWGPEIVMTDSSSNQQPSLAIYRGRLHVSSSSTLPFIPITGYSSCSMPCSTTGDFTRWVLLDNTSGLGSASLVIGNSGTSDLFMLQHLTGANNTIYWRSKNSE